MSGAAGLSAARRRRAGGASNNSSQNVQVDQAPTRISVQSILENHEIRLREIEPRLKGVITGELEVAGVSGTATVDTGVLDTIAENKTSVDSLAETVSSLKVSLADIQATVLRLTNKVAELSANTGVSVANVASEVVDEAASEEVENASDENETEAASEE